MMDVAFNPAQPFSIRDVVKTGLCTGCGACSLVTSGAIVVSTNQFLTQEASLNGVSKENLLAADSVCPMSDNAPNEDQIAGRVFGERALNYKQGIGFYNTLYAGRLNDVQGILESSSGGLTSWFLEKLIERDLIDGVIHVGFDENHSTTSMFKYLVSTDIREIRTNRKSQYYSVSIDQVVQSVKGNGRRYAFVGVPCFIKALRNVAQHDDELCDQIKFFIGLVCGHLKSGAFAEVLANQVGVPLDELDRVDFRIKNKNAPANSYDFGALNKKTGSWSKSMSRKLLGGNWGHAMFQLKACDYCDDIFAETADICFGDAWLAKYESNWRGTNAVVCRDPIALKILQSGKRDGEITLESLSAEEIATTQSGNFRHKKDGLSLRLSDDLCAGKKIPRKRLESTSKQLSAYRQKIVRLRRKMGYASHVSYFTAKTTGKLEKFFVEMNAHATEMNALYKHEIYGNPIHLSKAVFGKIYKWIRRRLIR